MADEINNENNTESVDSSTPVQENMPVNEVSEKPKKKKKKHYWWRYLLCFFSGMIFIPVVVGVTGYVASTQVKTADLIRFTGNNPDEVLTADYQNSTIWNIIQDMISGKISVDSLEGINQITPLLGSFEDDFINGLDMSADAKNDLREIINQITSLSFSDYGNNLYDIIMGGLKLKSFIDTSAFGEDPAINKIVDALFNKTEGGTTRPVTLKDVLKDGLDIAGALNNVELRDFVSGDFTGTVFEVFVDRLLYKGDGADKTPVTISDLMNDKDFFTKAFDEEFIKSIQISKIISIPEDANPLLKALKDKTIGDLTSNDFLNTLYLSDVLDIDKTDLNKYNNILLSLCFKKDSSGNYITDETGSRSVADLTKEGGLDGIINGIKLGDVIKTENKVFNAFSDMTIGDFSNETALKDKINSLKVSDLIGNEKTNPIVDSILDNTIGELQSEEFFDTKTLEEILGLESTSNKLLNRIKTKTLKEIQDGNILDGVKISDVLSDTEIESSPLLTALKDTEVSTLNQHSFDGVKIWDVLGISSSSSKILNCLKDSTVGSLSSDVDNMKFGDFMSEADLANSPLLRTLQNKKINELNANTFNELRISDIVEIDSSSPKFLQALRDKEATIGNIQATIETLKVGDVVDCTGSAILRTIQDCLITDASSISNAINNSKVSTFLPESSYCKYVSPDGTTYSNVKETGYLDNPNYNAMIGAISDLTIGNLDTQINNIKIKDMFKTPDPSTMFGKILNKIDDNATFGNLEATFSTAIDNMTLGELLDDTSSSSILKALAGYKVNELSSAIQNLKITTAFHDEIYGGGTELTGIWKYLLKDPAGIKSADDYTINEMASLANNVTSNIQNTKISDLVNDGIFSAPAGIIDKLVYFGGSPVKVGDLTLTQFFDAINAVL